MNFLTNYVKALFLTAILTASAICLPGCSVDDDGAIVCQDGEAWIMDGTEGGYIFTQDGDMIAVAAISDGSWYGAKVGTYSTGGGKLTLVLYGEKDTVKYKVSGGKLTLSGSGDALVFTKRTGVYVSF
jgi:hypothetical protein